VQFGRYILAFLRNLLPPSSGQKSKGGGDGETIFLRNADKDIPGYVASHPRIQCFVFRTDLIVM
jgi:hypothetical protein